MKLIAFPKNIEERIYLVQQCNVPTLYEKIELQLCLYTVTLLN